ncbi:MAG: hypothetical protein RL199_1978 [Pseudomonadota bacterium]|jgi:hypothetical protein
MTLRRRPLLLFLLVACGRLELLRPQPASSPDGTVPAIAPVLDRTVRPPSLIPAAGEPCVTDADCGTARLCTGGRCGDCPGLAGCNAPPASLGLVAIVRNGCTLCEYAPRSECESDGDCPVAGDHCYRGQRCIDGCTGTGCCINACAAPGCEESVPLGCRLAPFFCPTTDCLITHCTCRTDQKWGCAADPIDLPSSCEYSP